ncbi:MAG: glutamate racemase [Burkholderiaceae bacterium]|nr:glutamate racemase [Burkholderiaceae bacterium]
MADPVITLHRDAPIGIFDSGIGGLSVLRHVQSLLPDESLLYFADSGFAPYGEKPEAVIVDRAVSIAAFLLTQHIKALVVACNTATAAAIAGLRARYPDLPVVGVEPGLKPAASLTRSGTVGVLATANTLASEKFLKLQSQVAQDASVTFLLQACNGLAHHIEKGELSSRETQQLVEQYVKPLLAQHADTLVLGCTHYPFVEQLIRDVAGPDVNIVDTGEPVARQLQRLLTQRDLLRSTAAAGHLLAYTTGSSSTLSLAFSKLLRLDALVQVVSTTHMSH